MGLGLHVGDDVGAAGVDAGAGVHELGLVVMAPQLSIWVPCRPRYGRPSSRPPCSAGGKGWRLALSRKDSSRVKVIFTGRFASRHGWQRAGQHADALFLTAEGAAQGLLENPHRPCPRLGRRPHRGGCEEGVLAGGVDSHHAVGGVLDADHGLGLDVGVLNELGLILPLDDEVRPAKPFSTSPLQMESWTP